MARILLAEDERELSNALVAVLKAKHYSVDAVYDGQDAFDYLDTGLYDVAVLDIMMPKMDGITVLKKIRAKGDDVPVLLLTAKSEIDDRVEGLDAGADDYLTKPFAMKELLARIRAISRRQGEVMDSVLAFEDLHLNTAAFLLFREGGEQEAISLSNKEYQIMEMLMANPGQIISADQFMDKIWGYDTETEQNVVWVYISNLRKKLKQLGVNVRIKAVRGLGYQIIKGDS